MLMYVEMGWCEYRFEEMVVGYAIFYGGLGQLLVAIFELIKGSTYPFVVFGSYGAFWLGWGLVVLQNHSEDSEFTGDYIDGKTLWFVQWGILTFCFWCIALRKNVCLMIVLGLLWLTFFLLAAAASTGNVGVKNAAGYAGFLTAIAAWYTAMAEITNEEFGYHLLPGLKPILQPEREQISEENISKRLAYDSKTNTMFVQFRGLNIKTTHDILNIQDALKKAFLAANSPKVHVVVDYEDALIAEDICEKYWEMVGELERTYYLSAKRFHVTSFGTRPSSLSGNVLGMREVAMSWNGPCATEAVEEAAGPHSN